MTGYTKFFFRRCPAGHMSYWEATFGPENPDQFCWKCGEKYLEKCSHCSADLENSFTAYKTSLGIQPWQMPKRSDYCGRCGKPYPWTTQQLQKIEESGIWSLLHIEVVDLAKRRFESGHYADAVEAVFKALNAKVKKIYKQSKGEERDGTDLMRKAFRCEDAAIVLGDLSTETGRNIQEGYLAIFAGVMQAIRNPHAHENSEISAEQACHLLMLGSLLFHQVDRRITEQNGAK